MGDWVRDKHRFATPYATTTEATANIPGRAAADSASAVANTGAKAAHGGSKPTAGGKASGDQYHVFSEIEPGHDPSELQHTKYTVSDYNPTLRHVRRQPGPDGKPIGSDKALDKMNRAAVTPDLPNKLTQAAHHDGYQVGVQGALAGYGAYQGKSRPNILFHANGTDGGVVGLMSGLVNGASQESAIAMRRVRPEDYIDPNVKVSNVFRLVFPRPLTGEEHGDLAQALYDDPELQLDGRPLLDGHSAIPDPETGEYAILHGDMFWDATDPLEWATAVANKTPRILEIVSNLGHNRVTSDFTERSALTHAFTPTEGLAGGRSPQTQPGVKPDNTGKDGTPASGRGAGRQTLPQVWGFHLSDIFSQLRNGSGGTGVGPPPPPKPPGTGSASGNAPGANSSPPPGPTKQASLPFGYVPAMTTLTPGLENLFGMSPALLKNPRATKKETRPNPANV